MSERFILTDSVKGTKILRDTVLGRELAEFNDIATAQAMITLLNHQERVNLRLIRENNLLRANLTKINQVTKSYK